MNTSWCEAPKVFQPCSRLAKHVLEAQQPARVKNMTNQTGSLNYLYIAMPKQRLQYLNMHQLGHTSRIISIHDYEISIRAFVLEWIHQQPVDLYQLMLLKPVF